MCSAGLLRSPTTAVVLSQEPYNFNTRAAGLDTGHALVAVDEILLHWAQEIVCMNEEQEERLNDKLKKLGLTKTPVIALGIPDSFPYRDPELMKMIKEKYDAKSGRSEAGTQPEESESDSD
ncbi:MAG: hypothetical protein OIN85_00995 [Candidatus Methanoperedens sp.]|nr:hypothetical protein [Candidatus Methanoperedens sp.]